MNQQEGTHQLAGVGVVSNDAATNRGPLRIPVLPRLANDVCEAFEGMVGTDVNTTEDMGGVMSRDSSSMGGRLLRGLPHLAAGCEMSESGYKSALRKDLRGHGGASPAVSSSRAESSSSRYGKGF
jgi:hypothetical protein